MGMYSLDQLLSRLPDCDRFPVDDPLPSGVGYVDQGTPQFVPPNLSDIEVRDGSVPAQVVIVSAPGAVGKSTLAREIAYKKGALLWDLALAPEVGSGSLNGMLFDAVGTRQTDFLEYMSEGLQLLIVDALDEGRIKVNENSFQRLLDDIGKLARNSKGICFVLLGRTRIADTAWLVLDEAGVNASIISIESFDRKQANQYIENYVSPGKLTGPLIECRDLILEQLAFSVADETESDSAREFLHYPPVLDVVATLLKDEPNPFALKNSLNSQFAGAQDSSVDLLQTVILQILDREQTKVLPAIKQSLNERAERLNWSDWKSLYSNDEQCKRLLGSVLHQQVQTVPDDLPDVLRPLYENLDEIAAGFLGHPFLQGEDKFANRVFESYLYSRALLGDFGSELKQLVTQDLLKHEHLPTRLLAEFYFAGSGAPADTLRTIMPEHLGILYDSLLSQESNRSHVRLNVDGPDPLDDLDEDIDSVEVEFEFLTYDLQGELQTPFNDLITFSLPIQNDSVISFPSYLRDARITVPCTVELGVGGKEVTIGPAVHISAYTVVMRSETLIVGGHTKPRTVEEEDDRVIIEARTCHWSLLTNPLKVYEPDKFLVSWHGAEQYPWTVYRSERSQEDFADNEDLIVAYRRFKRIATAFRSHGQGSLARTKVKIEHQRVLQGAIGQALLDQLKEDGILMLGGGGNTYFWSSQEADKLLGVSWQDLRKWEMPELLREYLSKFIDRNRGLFR